MSSATLIAPEITALRAAEMLGQQAKSTIKWATYAFALRGLSPIMLDRMTDDQVLGLVTGKKVDFPKDEPLETKAQRKMYSNAYKEDMPSGEYGVPAENLYAALRDAGVAVQYGSGKNDRITMSTKGTQLYSMIRLHDTFFTLLDLEGNPAEWKVDLRKGNATQGNGAVGIIRPKFEEWGIVGYVDVNIDKLSPNKTEELFTLAGINQGLCSARPANKMPFGQFALTHFEWITGADPSQSVARATKSVAKKKSSTKDESSDSENGTPSANGDGE